MKPRVTRKFVVRYYHDSQWWGDLIDAYDEADAEVRCRKLGMQLDGELMLVIPGWIPFADLLVRCICGIRNFLRL